MKLCLKLVPLAVCDPHWVVSELDLCCFSGSWFSCYGNGASCGACAGKGSSVASSPPATTSFSASESAILLEEEDKWVRDGDIMELHYSQSRYCKRSALGLFGSGNKTNWVHYKLTLRKTCQNVPYSNLLCLLGRVLPRSLGRRLKNLKSIDQLHASESMHGMYGVTSGCSFCST